MTLCQNKIVSPFDRALTLLLLHVMNRASWPALVQTVQLVEKLTSAAAVVEIAAWIQWASKHGLFRRRLVRRLEYR